MKELYERNLYVSYDVLLSYSYERFETVFANDNNIKEFIINKYHIREKGKAFEVATKRFNLFSKGKHEVSTYLLGCLLKDIIWDDLKDFIKEYIDEKYTDYSFDFEYIWSLLAVYHDIVVDKEQKLSLDYENKQLSNTNEIVECIRKHSFDIERNIYQDDYSVVPLYHTYQDELVVNYMNMRMESSSDAKGCLDHGIAAGFLLYDALVNNYSIQKTNAKCDCEAKHFSTKSSNNISLIWHELDIWIYGYISDAIIAHNIWFCDLNKEKEETKYKKFKLDYLIVGNENDNRLSVKNNPLAFYLGLIDTIEPIKSFCNADNIEVEEICKKVDFCSEIKKISIKRVGELNNFDKYKNKIKEMERWLKVEVENDGDDISIKIL